MTSGAIDQEIASCLSEELGALEQLRALLQGNEEVSIPGVVVAGAQSAGKSSVMEALGGMKLPRGQNITTRAPLILSLVTVPGVEPHAVISGDADLAANGAVIDIDDVSTEIERLTNELAGDGSAVSSKPIYLKILRPSGPTLTLIDLPGITHNSANGKQDIHTETVNLVKKFISEDNMVRPKKQCHDGIRTSSTCILLGAPSLRCRHILWYFWAPFVGLSHIQKSYKQL